jgi:colicin import membrane protein
MTTQRIKINIKKAAAEEVAPLKQKKASVKVPITFGEEVDALVAEWYAAKGMEVPVEERNLAPILDKQREDEWKEIMIQSKRLAGETVLDEEGKPQPPLAAGQKPEFGTPEFWAWARRRRAEEDAKRVAEGLPPLPTKKEKEAAKAAKAVAKAAKADEKAAKEKEKAEAKAKKEAAKAAKASAKN